MRTNKPETLNSFLSTVRKYDAPLADRMVADNIRVRIIDSQRDFDRVSTGILPWNGSELVDGINRAFGVTVPHDESDPVEDHTIWLNDFSIKHHSKDIDVPCELFGATVLVHEYTHRNGAGEPTAYRAGTAFARKTGNRNLITEAVADQKRNG